VQQEATTAHVPTAHFEPAAVQNAAAPHFPSAADRRCQQARNTLAADKIEKSKSKEAGTTTTVGPCWVEALLAMCATALKETFTDKHFFDYAFGATYKVKSTLGAVIEIKIPTTIAAALNDKRFAYQWRMAIQDELQYKFATGYEFKTVITNLNSREVMQGIWIFETETNPDTTAIDFEAKWVNDNSTKTTTVAYETTIAGMRLSGVNVTNVDKAPDSQTKRSRSPCSTCTPPPYSPSTYVPPELKPCCPQCNKQHQL
jgi:hypothetical protein